MIRRLLWLVGLLLAATALWAMLAVNGFFGQRQQSEDISQIPRQVQPLTQSATDGVPPAKQVLFGDLHVHSTFSFDAYNISLPMFGGEGAHPPADACDFARYCSALDFWSINDHAEGLTPNQWQQTRELVRDCNAVSGDTTNPDMVTFLGWEWTQIGNTPEDHYGHKNVILRDTEEGSVPARPIASREQLFPGGGNPFSWPMRLLFIVLGQGGDSRQPYHDFARFLEDRDNLTACEKGVPVRELPADCQESAATPTELFARLDEWGFPYYTIPHGNSWGFYTPPLSSWDKQLAAHTDPDKHEPLIEVFSGHGNIEQYKSWRAVEEDKQGQQSCPPPTPEYLPECWQAGEIIRRRCLDAGESEQECETRAAGTRANFILTKDSGHWTVPGSELEDWLDAGQCTDCYMPAYNHRPTSSMQYGLAIRDFSDPDRPPKRFRWGVIGSSDVHSARPGNGYKEILRRSMTDGALGNLGPPRDLVQGDPGANFVTLDELGGLQGPYFERFSSFLGTGGLVAVHADARDRQSIWQALGRKEVYATSGGRTLLWFDLLNAGSAPVPMGSSVVQSHNPEFEVRALGDWEQKPGCPETGSGGLTPERLLRLCAGECYNPGETRRPVDRIEVVRIRPQVNADEDVGKLIEDPWLVLPCPGEGEGCNVRFSDPDFAAGQRDALYYVRALERASPTINGDQLRCEAGPDGECIAVDPCRAPGVNDLSDDCLADAQERAWSSPIFVDFGL